MRIGVCVCVFAVLNWDKGKQSKEQRQRNEERVERKQRLKESRNTFVWLQTRKWCVPNAKRGQFVDRREREREGEGGGTAQGHRVGGKH